MIPANTAHEIIEKNHMRLTRFANRIIPGKTEVRIIPTDEVESELIKQASEHDLVIMGLGKASDHEKAFGKLSLALAEKTNTALIFISKK